MATKIIMFDPSEIFRPEDCVDQNNFRNYNIEKGCPEHVRNTYYEMHSSQTLKFVMKKNREWLKFDKNLMTLMEGLRLLNQIVDQSDPDTALPNIVHAFQTAERVRKAYPKQDWFHLVGLIHDLGKVMAFFNEPQWSVVGDTYPVGCAPSPKIVFGIKSFHDNPDLNHPIYGAKYGIYQPNCGLDKLVMSWGHDEYMYRFLQHNTNFLPPLALNIIRFHSFYPWHKSGDYMYLCKQTPDLDETLKYTRIFNHFDLYSKSDDPMDLPDLPALEIYYNRLIDKYFGDSQRKLQF